MSVSRIRGPIRVSPNGRYFIDSEGAPFFWLGDTAWPLFSGYTKDEAARYLKDRSQKGFTVIQGVFAWGDPVEGNLFGTRPGPNPNGDHPWNVSPAQPDPKYFDYVDQLLNLADQLGLVVAAFPTWGVNVNQFGYFDEQSAYAYGLWLGQRYRQQNNLIWMNGGDREPLGFEAVYRALARGLRAGDGGAHLISYHPNGWRSASYFFADDDWLDFYSLQTWTDWTKSYTAVASDYGVTPIKPVVQAEGAYENGWEYPMGPINALVCRRQAWWCWMAGGFHTYGVNLNWLHPAGWVDQIDTPGANDMTRYKQIVTSRRWWEMVPDQSLFDSNISSGRTLNAAVRAKDRTWAMAYLSQQCDFVFHIGKVATRRVHATWVNPQSGESLDGGTYITGNCIPGEVFPVVIRQHFETPPFWEDAVLILDGID
jgi:hypothetical protein